VKVFRLILMVVTLVIAESFFLQLTVNSDDVKYPLIPLGSMKVAGFYSPTSALVDISFVGYGNGSYAIVDLENFEVLQEGKLKNEVIRVELPHPGHYGIIVNGSYSGSATIRVIDVGFPRSNWRIHFLTLSFVILLLSLSLWREGE